MWSGHKAGKESDNEEAFNCNGRDEGIINHNIQKATPRYPVPHANVPRVAIKHEPGSRCRDGGHGTQVVGARVRCEENRERERERERERAGASPVTRGRCGGGASHLASPHKPPQPAPRTTITHPRSTPGRPKSTSPLASPHKPPQPPPRTTITHTRSTPGRP